MNYSTRERKKLTSTRFFPSCLQQVILLKMGNSPRSVRTALLLKNDDDDDDDEEKEEADEGVAVSACLESASRRRARVERFRRQLRCSSAFDVLRSASPRERDDKALLVEAVRLSGHALSYASPRLRGDRECALAAVRQDGSSLQVCATELQDDAGVVEAACRQDGRALCWASARLRRAPPLSSIPLRGVWRRCAFAPLLTAAICGVSSW